ncbi:MAG: PPC domain-containing DNA-binding protein [Bradymonadaceae bacterium]
MIYQESERVRRIVGRLDEGEEIVEAVSTFCRDHNIDAAEIRGVGRLDRIELVRFDPEIGDYREVFSDEGHFDLLNLNGNVATLGDEIAVRLQAVVSANGPVAPQVVAGQLRSGRALEFEFVLEVFDDLELERRLDSETGLLGLQAVKKKQVDEPVDSETTPGGAESWRPFT